MLEYSVILLALFIIISTIVYIVKDIISTRRIKNAEVEIDLCNSQIKGFNENVNAIQHRLTAIENRLSNIEHNTIYNGCNILHD